MTTDDSSPSHRRTMLEVQNEMLLALLNEFRELEDPEDPDNPPLFAFRIAESIGIDASKSVLKLCIDGLANDGLITVGDSFEASSPDFFCFLTAKGVIRAEKIESDFNTGMIEKSNNSNGDTAPSSLSTNPDTTPQASTVSSSETFGFAPDSAPFGSGTFADTPSAPASDRYVSVRDNQSGFDEISRSLTTIKDEFAKDYFKQTNSINTPAVIAEIEAFEHQVRSGWVSRPAAQSLLETLKYIEAVCVSSSKIIGAIAAITASLTIIFGFVL